MWFHFPSRSCNVEFHKVDGDLPLSVCPMFTPIPWKPLSSIPAVKFIASGIYLQRVTGQSVIFKITVIWGVGVVLIRYHPFLQHLMPEKFVRNKFDWYSFSCLWDMYITPIDVTFQKISTHTCPSLLRLFVLNFVSSFLF